MNTPAVVDSGVAHAQRIGGLATPGALDFLCLRFACRAAAAFQLDNPASDLHGGFGLMLHAHSPGVYQALMGAQNCSGDVRPYVLRALPSLESPVAAGGLFSFELLLFGEAIRHAGCCLEMLFRLGEQGLTARHHRYRIESVHRIAPQGEALLWSPGAGWRIAALQPVAAAELLALTARGVRLRLEWLSPVRLKQDNQILRETPAPGLLMQRLLGRASLLSSQESGQTLVPERTERWALIEAASALRCSGEAMAWVRAQRYSVRQRQSMDIGGLSGSMLLDGDFSLLAGWLELGQWLHVGGKTSFGLGRYRLEWLDGE